MKGTIDRPRDVSGPVPGIVIMHGSGPNSREGRVSGQLNMTFPEPVSLHEELGTHLASKGYAVLRYDKRSCVPLNSCSDNGYPAPSSELTPRQFIEDGAAAVDHLVETDGISTDEIYVIGHSQGAALAPFIASRRSQVVRGAVLLAGTPATLGETIRYQYEQSLEDLKAQGLSKKEARARLSRLREGAEDLETLEEGMFMGSKILGQPIAFWEKSLEIRNRLPDIIEGLTQPLLSLSGTLDRNVPPRFARRWKPLFQEGTPRLEHRLVIQDCISHAMNCITDPDLPYVEPESIGRHVHAKVETRLLEYLDRVHRSLAESSP